MNNSSKLLDKLSPSMLESLESLSQAEGTSVDDLLILAIAEKLARTEHSAWLAARPDAKGEGPARLNSRGASEEIGTSARAQSPATTAKDDATSVPDTAATSQGRTQEDRELKSLEYLFEGAPVFVAVLAGSDHVFEMANQSYRDLLGNRDLIGRRVVDCIPEVAGTVWMDLLDHVYRTGEPKVERRARLSLAPVAGQPLEDKYVDYAYKARREADGTISGIIAMGVDTSLIQKVLESESGRAFLLDQM